MLGRGPISSTPISGSPFSLVSVAASLAATATIVFGSSATPGAIVNPSGTAGISLAATATLIVNQAIAGTATITFGDNAVLRVAGKPIKLSAVPQSFDLRANMDRMTLRALPESLTLRGSQ